MIQGRVAQVWKDRVEFLERNLATFRDINANEENFGEYRYQMFTCLTQHIHGNSITELLDKGLIIERTLRDEHTS